MEDMKEEADANNKAFRMDPHRGEARDVDAAIERLERAANEPGHYWAWPDIASVITAYRAKCADNDQAVRERDAYLEQRDEARAEVERLRDELRECVGLVADEEDNRPLFELIESCLGDHVDTVQSLTAEVERLTALVNNHVPAKWLCKSANVQNCHVCEDADCDDNRTPSIVKLRAEVERLKAHIADIDATMDAEEERRASGRNNELENAWAWVHSYLILPKGGVRHCPFCGYHDEQHKEECPATVLERHIASGRSGDD